MNTHSSVKVAGRLIELAKADDNTLTPMQIIKLDYLCHGWMLGLYHRPLIKENVEAWQYGPVIPELYAEVKKFRSSPVDIEPATDGEPFDSGQEDIIKQVYDVYGHFTGIQLSALTHAEGTPWYKTWNNGQGRNNVISNDLIEEHFASKVRE